MPSDRFFFRQDARCKASVHLTSHYLFIHSRASLRPRTAGSLALSATVHTSTSNPSPTVATTEPNVDINSLENTLRAHREVNRASVIRKTTQRGRVVPIDGGSLGLPAIRVGPPAQQEKVGRFTRVDLAAKKTLKGTSRDLDALWRISDTERTPPVQSRLPWLRHLDASEPASNATAVDRLTAEIRAFEIYSSPTCEEQKAADDAIQDVVQSVHQLRDGFVIDVIGSRATNLADPLSDLDINVFDSNHPEYVDDETPLKVLKILNKTLRWPRKAAKSSPSRAIETQIFLKHARVPILLCQHRPTGLPIQIQSTPRTYDSREYVKASLREYPSLRGLFKILKQVLQMRALTVGSSGGITSYPLLQMILASLKFSEGRFHPADVGSQFLYFLDFYSDVDFAKHGISTEPLELFLKGVSRASDQHENPKGATDRIVLLSRGRADQQSSTFQRRSQTRFQKNKEYLMTLQDPANPKNDLGQSCFLIQDVQETFIAIRSAMKRAMAEWDQRPSPSMHLGQQIRVKSLLEPCVGGDYRIYEHERDDLRDLGRRSMKEATGVVASNP